jgi:alpha-L-rhamnosidase
MQPRQISIVLLSLLGFIGCQSASDPRSVLSQVPWPITEAGAVGDGKTLNTAAIQKTIDRAAAAGGGTVVIPKGVFLSGAIFLKPGVNLHLDAGAVLKGTTNLADYPMRKTRVEGHFTVWVPALVNADGVDHLRISGDGALDGSGQPFWTTYRTQRANDPKTTNLGVPRPRLMYIADSADVRISGLYLKDSGFWNLHIYKCHDVTVDGLNIRAPRGAPSTDGMDIDSCQNVTIKGCDISVSDDCIALKGSKGPFALKDKDSPPVEHIRISDCIFRQGGGISTVGSEATIVRDVVEEHCQVIGPGTAGISLLRLKLRPDTPEDYEDIHVRDITVDGAGRLVSIEPWRQFFDLQGQPPPTRLVRNVSLEDVHGTYGAFGRIQPNAGDTVEDITIKNIDVELTGDPTLHSTGVKNLTLQNVKIDGKIYK